MMLLLIRLNLKETYKKASAERVGPKNKCICFVNKENRTDDAPVTGQFLLQNERVINGDDLTL